MKVFDRYIFRNLTVSTVFIAVTLAVVVLLTQSLRFLELVINAGASGSAFWILTLLALPRFFEIIVPLALMAGTVFVYNRMSVDSELIVVRAVGYSPFSLARPALILGLIVTVLLWGMTMWVAPKSLAHMHEMRQAIKAQFSALLFREGVFNQAGKGLTVYIRERDSKGDLYGLMIYDSRETGKNPSTVLAKRGALLSVEGGYQVLVYDGTRLEYDRGKGTLSRLNFERYTIDLPDSGPVRQRWQQPDERTILELLNPDPQNARDVESSRDFRVEIHRRVVSPLLALQFVLISCVFLLLGSVDRRGQGWRIVMCIGGVVLIQSLYLVAFNLSRHSDAGLLLMYGLVLIPSALSAYMLSGLSEQARRRILYRGGVPV